LGAFQPDVRYRGGYRHVCRYCTSEDASAAQQAARLAALEALGGRCEGCGIADERVLTIDHVKGGGRLDRARAGSPLVFYRQVAADTSGYQCLCFNCNHLKRLANNEHGPGIAASLRVVG
jgi:hypothetical protein